MEMTFKPLLAKGWTLTDDKIIYGKNEYLLNEITKVDPFKPAQSSLNNGIISITVKGKWIILATPFKSNEDAKKAYKYICEKAGIAAEPDEYRKKCNVCGKVYCYTREDLIRNRNLAKQAMMSSLASVGESLGGTRIGAHTAQQNADNATSRIIDYSKCPYCNSTDIVDVSEEEFKAASKLAAPETASAADEIKKFKELLDSGVITQEEFDAKKKQLLGL